MSWRETLDQINPFDFMNAAPAVRAPHNSGEGDPSVMADCAGAATRFELDGDAFMAAIEEPAPLFLQDRNEVSDVEETLREIAELIGRAA